MDDIVKQAMVKWPNVPNCFGWLGLDARGNWYMRDDQAQALGSFTSGAEGAKGSLLQHEKLIGFIERNYEVDPDGRWFFQNGPQRVYVELEAAPWVWRVQEDGSVQSHTGQSVQVNQALTDESGRVFLVTDRGLGLVHTQDVLHAAEAVERGDWMPESVRAGELPARYGYVLSPEAETR
ncbi:DUF2946 family protein [Ottowia thiooxydans]|uniref:DUF2946 family protein n=1 Tax=Ottowia thiooxydans TaxID=219182 RepID=UPI0003F9524C|nr:DUF2946 family protein [Ottowia thiooxydans]